MTSALRKSRHQVVIREASGALSVADNPMPIYGLEGYRRATVVISQEANLLTPDGDDRVRFLIDVNLRDITIVDSTANTIGAIGGGPASGLVENSVTDIETTDGTQFEVGDIVRIDQERMRVTAINPGGLGADFIRVDRGLFGDPVQAHVTATDIFRGRTEWFQVANITYDDSDDGTQPAAVVQIVAQDGNLIIDDLDEALADNSVLNLPLGDSLRIRVTIAGATAPTYNYEAHAILEST